MKLLETARKTVQKATTGAAKAIAAPASGIRDPYSEDQRKAEINARGLRPWLGPRRKGWLR